MLLFAFILLVLYITGIIETAIQLFGNGNVSDNCQRLVMNNQVTGFQVNTLLWIEQYNICKTFLFLTMWRIRLTNHRQLLVCRLQLLDSRRRVVPLDDDYGKPSGKRRVRLRVLTAQELRSFLASTLISICTRWSRRDGSI